MKLVEISPLVLLAVGLASCKDEAKRPASPEPTARGATTPSATQAASAPQPSSTAPLPSASQAAAPSASATSTPSTCKVIQGNKTVYAGRCAMRPEGTDGSFSITPLDQPAISGANPVSVSVVAPGRAEVRGLTADGINSRWGEARRSSSDAACWDGKDFSVCVHGGEAGDGGAPATPKAVAQRQGGQYWAVYTAMGATQDTPAVKASIADLKKRGLQFGITFGYGSLGCDVGSAAALKAPDDTNAVAVYFATEADARAFATTLPSPSLAVVRIKAMCRD